VNELRSKIYCLLILTVGFVFCSGCATDIKNIEKLNYATALGVDFKDGKYYGYVQFIDFQSVAKTSDGKKEAAKVWVGEGMGSTYEESLFQIYRTAQERVYWGHVTAVLISEAALKEGFLSIYDSISRYYEFRLTPWVFATRESVKDILSVTGFYERSPLSTIIHEPKGIYSQTSIVKAIKVQALVRQITEPGYTVCIPSLSVNKKSWTTKDEPDPKLTIDGAVFLKDDRFKSFIPMKDLSGLRWIQRGTIRAAIPVPTKEKPSFQVVVDNPRTKLKYDELDRPQFDIHMKAKGYIVSRTDNRIIEFQELNEQTRKAIREEIRKVFLAGVKKKTDVLNLEYNLYRYHFSRWQAMSSVEDRLLTEDAIRNINIDLNISHTSSEKNTRVESSEK